LIIDWKIKTNRHSSRGRSFELIAAADEAINDGYILTARK
jgi:hypothetical protein